MISSGSLIIKKVLKFFDDQNYKISISFGTTKYLPDEIRVEVITELLDKGFIETPIGRQTNVGRNLFEKFIHEDCLKWAYILYKQKKFIVNSYNYLDLIKVRKNQEDAMTLVKLMFDQNVPFKMTHDSIDGEETLDVLKRVKEILPENDQLRKLFENLSA